MRAPPALACTGQAWLRRPHEVVLLGFGSAWNGTRGFTL
jgi:hypothetical protein